MQYAEQNPDEMGALSSWLFAHLQNASRIVESDQSHGRALSGRCLVCDAPVAEDEANELWVVVPDRGDAEGWPHATLGQTHQLCSTLMRRMSDAELALEAAWRRVKAAQGNAALSADGMRDWCLAAAEWAAAEVRVAEERGEKLEALEERRELLRASLANAAAMLATERWLVEHPDASDEQYREFMAEFRLMLDVGTTETIAAYVAERTAGAHEARLA